MRPSGRVFRGGATCQNPIEALQIKIHIFFSSLNPLQMTVAVSGRVFLNSSLKPLEIHIYLTLKPVKIISGLFFTFKIRP
jgi:hypothetical protein